MDASFSTWSLAHPGTWKLAGQLTLHNPDGGVFITELVTTRLMLTSFAQYIETSECWQG